MPVKKGKVSEKVSTKVLAALSTAFGREISFVDDLTYSEYSTELREAMMRVHPDTGGEYADEETFKILSTERDRIRGKNTEKELETFDREPTVNVKKTKISPSKFFDKKEKKPDAEGKGGAIVKIGNSVTSIVETLKEDQKQDKKQQGWFRKMVERVKRRKKENKLEFKIFDGLKKTATKLLAPMKNAWNEFLGFIGKVLLGRVLFKILEWMGDKENHGKLESIIKFFEDYWPAMLAGYLLFGNALTSMVTGMLIQMGKWLAPMLLAIGKLMLNPWVAAAVLAGGTALFLSNKKNKTDQKVDQSVEDVGKEETVNQLKEEKEDKNVFERVGGFFTGEGQEREEQIQRVETGTEKRYGFFGELERPAEFNKGGSVPGRGNKDTVPAMLTPGEFVMSKGAVQKYGANTLAGMNAAAGGTNKPKMGRYKGGGKAAGVVTDPEERKQQEAYMLKFVNEERVLQGMEPLTNLTYAPGVELTKAIGPGPKIKETSDTFTDLDKGIKTTSKSRTVDGETSIFAEIGQTTEQDRQKFFAENPQAAQLLNIKNQVELDNLGADMSSSARMNGGGLVQMFQGGGQVRQMGRSVAKSRSKFPNIKSRKTATVITPSEKKKNVIVAYEEEKQKMEDKPNVEQSEKKIPQFDVTLGRSSRKINVLGISV